MLKQNTLIFKLLITGIFGLVLAYALPFHQASAQSKQKGNVRPRPAPNAKDSQSTSTEAKWELFRYEKLGFEVSFPATPSDIITRSIHRGVGVSQNNHTFVVLVSDPPPVRTWTPQFTESFLAARKSSGFDIESFTKISDIMVIVKGLMPAPDGTKRSFVSMIIIRPSDGRDYEVSVRAPEGKLDPKMVERFHKGFNFI